MSMMLMANFFALVSLATYPVIYRVNRSTKMGYLQKSKNMLPLIRKVNLAV